MESGDRLLSEIVFLGRRLHWSLDELLDLDHVMRRRFVAELARTDD